MSEKKETIFISDDFGPSKIFDEQGLVAEFVNTKSNLIRIGGKIKRKDEKSIWVCVLTDPDKIARLRKNPEYGIAFKEVDSMPVMHQLNTLKSLNDPNFQASSPAAQAVNSGQVENAINDAKAVMKAKMKRFAELQPLVKKQDGNFKSNADPDLVEEFKILSSELELD